jgi:hypothetical protein
VALDLLRVVAVEGIKLNRDFWCIYRKQMETSRLLEEFITFIKTR